MVLEHVPFYVLEASFSMRSHVSVRINHDATVTSTPPNLLVFRW